MAAYVRRKQAAPGVPVTAAAAQPPIVGRDEALTALRASVDAVARGGTRVVGIAGDPGTGKTRLLTEISTLAQTTGMPVLWGRASEFEHQVPFGVFTNAIEDHLATVDRDRLARLGAERLRLLSHIFATLPVPDGTPPSELIGTERYRLHRAVRTLLEEIATPAGLVLILDDLHWADEGSVELLDHLLRHPPLAPIGLAAAYRPRQASGRLRRAVVDATAGGRVELVEIGPLSWPEARQLLPATMGEAAARRLFDTSGGSPLYLELLARFDDEGGHLPADGGDGAEVVPSAVRAALDAELAALTPGARTVAHAAAVAGEVFTASIVADVAALDERQVLAECDTLARRDLIRPAGPAGEFRFRHPLVRWSTYDHAGAGWRLGAHRRAARALLERGASLAEQAHHVERYAVPGDVAAAGLLATAGTAAMRISPATAAYWLGGALRLLPTGPAHAGTRLQLLDRQARSLGVIGRLRESREALREVLRLLPPQAVEQRAMTVGFCTMIERLLGNHADAKALLVTELNNVDDQERPATAILTLGLAMSNTLAGDPDDTWRFRAVAAARRVGRRALLAAALSMLVVSRYSEGVDDDRTGAWLDEAVLAVDSLPDVELAGNLDAALWLGWAELYAERFTDAARHIDRGLQVARATGRNHLAGYLYMIQGMALAQSGELAAAAVALDNAMEVALLTGSAEITGRILTYQCWVRTCLGDVEEALTLGERAVIAIKDRNDRYTDPADGMLALARFHHGDHDGCIDLLLKAGGGPELLAVRSQWRITWYELLAAAEVAAGRPRESAGWAARAQQVTVPPGHSRQGFIQLAQAHPLLDSDPARAADWAAAAAASFSRVNDRVNGARAHLVTGIALGHLDQHDRARAAFSQARSMFAACGARLLLKETVREERRMNARQPRRSKAAGDGGAGLTGREQQIADCLLAGLTNKQIGEKLHLSPKTVEAHLSRLFAKLGVTTRGGAAAMWAGRP